MLLKHGAGPQRVGGRAVLEDVVMETGELLSQALVAPPSQAPVLHGEQLGAQVAQPQHVGVGVVVTPVISERRHRDQQSVTQTTRLAQHTNDINTQTNIHACVFV